MLTGRLKCIPLKLNLLQRDVKGAIGVPDKFCQMGQNLTREARSVKARSSAWIEEGPEVQEDSVVVEAEHAEVPEEARNAAPAR